VALFSAALLTKETAAALPLVWATHALLLEPRLRTLRRLGPIALAWAALVAVRVGLGSAARAATVVSTSGSTATLSSGMAGLLAGLGKLALYVRPTVIATTEDVPVWPGALALVVLVGATFTVQGVRLRVMGLGAAAVVFPLVPPLLLGGTLVLDERLYVPAVGVTLLLGELVRALAPSREVLLGYAGVTIALLGAMTLGFEGAYKDRRAFAREAVFGSPHSALAHFCLGQSDQLDGNDDGALAEYRIALTLGPAEVVHNNIAVIAMKRGHWDEAESELRQELEYNPRYGKAHYNLAIVLRHLQRMPEACAAATEATTMSSGDAAVDTERARDCAAAQASPQ
jgi:hypothetical protein